ncbi:ribosomal RNA large subunit methyltransferase J [Coprinopsis sp. MPI-PUGE-AT-0042]|nr:ribosomal RNA large subunit methyltransferase J [Coprinopsis sp. MPI-PUGE-AT-0042]
MSFRATTIRLAKKSSKQLLVRQTKDPYVKQRQLVEINKKCDNFLAKPDVNVVVDLGVAPGGWISEDRFDPLAFDDADLVSTRVPGRGTILAVDSLQMPQIHGVHDLIADFLAPTTDSIIQDILRRQGVQDGKVNVILSGMAANASGNDTRDIECSLQICEAVLDFAKRHLRTAQTVGRKRAGHEQELAPRFSMVKFLKPDSSRAESREGYFLCMDWRGDRQ